MGKDATNTLFAENQAVAEQRDISGLKGEQFNSSDSRFKSEQLKDSNGFQEHHLHEGTHHREQPLDMGITGQTILRPQGEQSSFLPTSTFKALEGAPVMENHFQGAELKSQSGIMEHGTTNFHDGRFRDGRDEPALHENQVLQPALHAERFEDNTMRDATIHDGRSRPLVPEANPMDRLPLADRIVAGVQAGDPLSSSTLKKSSIEKIKAKKDKKFKKDKKLEQSAFGRDAHLRSDSALIPHDHLKMDHSTFSDQHLAGGSTLQKQERFDERLSDAPIILKKDEQFIGGEVRTETFIAAGENHIVKEETTLKQSSFKKDKKDKKLKKDKHFTNDAHLNKDVNIVEAGSFNRDVNLYNDGRAAAFEKDSRLMQDSDLNKDAHLSRDSRFSKDLNIASNKDFHQDSLMRDARVNDQDAFIVTEDHSRDLQKQGSGKKGGKLKDKLHSKKEKIKAKLGMKKEENLPMADAHAQESHASGSKGHEIATIKIPGIESGDRAAQEMVNHQAKAKKELNAELKEHAGHSDHFAPSEISGLGHGMAQMNLHENRAVDSQMPLMANNRNSDQITRDQVHAKSELNADFKNQVGELGSGHIIPSDVSAKFSEQDRQFAKDSQFSRDSNLLAKDQQFFNKPNDSLEKDAVLAKNDVNAEIKKAAGHGFFGATDHIQPSDINKPGFTETLKEKAIALKDQFQPAPAASLDAERLAGLSGNNDLLMQDNMLAKKDVNAEIKKAAGHGFFGATDHIQPSDVAHKPGFTETLKEKAIALKDQLQPAPAASLDARQMEAERLAGLSGNNDALMQDNMLAKKDVNAEIKKAAGHGFFGATDHIQPSDINKPGFTETLKEKAIALKDQFQPAPAASLDARQMEAERLAGLSGTDDLLMKDNMLAKKDLNAEIKKAAGHGIFGATDHIMPSDVAPKPIARDTKHLEAEKLAGLSGAEDSDNILAKKDVNAEIKKAAGHGFFGATDHIQPSDVAPKPGFTEMLKNAAFGLFHSSAKADDKHLEAERLAGLSGTDDALMKENMLAKKDVNAEITKAGRGFFGPADHINPSAVSSGYPHREIKHFEGEQLAGLSGEEDAHNILLKKDVNSEINKASHGIFGVKDHILPSKVSSGYPHRDAKHFEGEQLAGLSGEEDSQALLAKKDINAEIKKAAGHGFFGATDHIQPSAVAPKHIPKHIEGEQLAGLSGSEDSQNILAKKDVNAEIKKAAGHGIFGATDHIQPSAVAPKHVSKHLEGEQLAGLSGSDDLLMKDNMLAKKGINAEIKKAAGPGIFGAPDHILPSDVNKPGLVETIKEKAANAAILAKEQALVIKEKAANAAIIAQDQALSMKDRALAAKEQYKPSAATIDARNLEAQKLAGFSAEDSLAKENVLAKKDVNAEIKQVAGTGLFASDHIMPSDVAHSQQGLGDRIKDTAANAASAIKGQFQASAPLEGEKLAGLSASNDALMQDNILAKKEVNAEIKSFGTDNIHPSEIAPVAAGGITVIHDGRSDHMESEHLGSDRLKSEMDYEQAKGTAIEERHMPSLVGMIKEKVVGAASIALAAAGAVKGQFQAATSREISEEEFPGEFQKEDFERELGVGAVQDSALNDDIMKDSILAKKEVNAEIKEHAPAIGDNMLPSDISSAPTTHDSAHLSMTELIKERVSNAASTVKETLQNLH